MYFNTYVTSGGIGYLKVCYLETWFFLMCVCAYKIIKIADTFKQQSLLGQKLVVCVYSRLQDTRLSVVLTVW